MTADNAMHGRRFLVVGVGFTALALVSAGCVEERRFAQAAATKDTRQLVVPSRITPPVTVARIEGAPKNWQFSERLAKALRRRDIPAGTRSRGKASYLVRGRAEPLPRKSGAEGSHIRQLRISWSLHDATGKRVGTVVQVAAIPGAVWEKPDPRILDQLASLAAASLRPYVPNAPVGGSQTASGAGSGRLARPPVTAIGRQDARRGGRGLSGRLLAMRRVTGFRTQTPEERIAMKRAAKAPAGTTAPSGAKVARGAAGPVIKPATPRSAHETVTRRTVVTEGLARVAGTRVGKRRTTAGVATRQKAPPIIKASTTRGQNVRKPSAIRPDANRAKFRLSGGARPVQIAEASRRGGAPVGMVQNTKGYWVQLASNTTAQASHAAWTTLVSNHRDLLGRQPHAVNRADLGRKGIYYRLQLGPYPNVAQARRICASLRTARITCIRSLKARNVV